MTTPIEAGSAPPTPDDDESTTLPRWFCIALRSLLALLVTFMVTGVLLAMVGAFHPLPTIALTAVVGGGAVWWNVREVRPRAVPRTTHAVVALVVLGAIAVGGWNSLRHAQHLIVNRDPGVYLTTARWLTDEGDLRVDGFDPAFGTGDEVFVSVPGFSSDDGEPNYPQFPHGLPVVMAGVGWVDADLLLVVNPWLGSLALLCVFAAASTVTRPFWAAAATGVLGVTFPFVFMARDAYSEPLAMLLLFGGLWLFARDRAARPATAALAGALLGGVCMTRIDGLVSLIPVAAVSGLWLRHALGIGDRARVRWVGIVVAATTTTTLIGIVDTRFLSPDYFRGDLEPRLAALVAGIVGAGVLGFLGAPLLWRIDGARWRPRSFLTALTVAGSVGLTAVLVWMAVFRPAVENIPVLAEDLGGARLLDFQDQLGTLSYRWLEFYLGRAGTALAFAGLVGILAVAILRRPDASSLVLPGVVLATTMLYLLAPNITPDQPWAMRRFLAVSIPGLLIGSTWLVGRVWELRPSRVRWAGPLVAAPLLVAIVVPVVTTTNPLRAVRVGYPSRAAIGDVCDVADDEPSAVVVATGGLLNFTLPMTVRSWCEVPAAGAAVDLTASATEDMARRWAEQGRRLLVLSDEPDAVDRSIRGDVQAIDPVSLRAPEVTLTREPRALVPDLGIVKHEDGVLRLYLTEVEVAPEP